MSLDQKQFERLEEYLDGTLEAGPRAELERELITNAKLQKMMKELASVRDWVTALPRAAAPSDLIETFQGQLERAALFGEGGPAESDVSLRIDRWSHFMSVAAILLLATGLGLVLYKVLPDKRPNTVAMNGRVLLDSGEVVATKPSLLEAEKKWADARPMGTVGETQVDKASTDRSREIMSGVGGGGNGGGFAGKGGPAGDALAKQLDTTIVLEGLTSKSTTGPSANSDQFATPTELRRGAVAKAAPNDRDQVAAADVRLMQQRMAGGTPLAAGGGAMKPAGPEEARDAKRDFAARQGQEAPIVLLVNAQDPRQANQDVVEFFAKNSITSLPMADAAYSDLPARSPEMNNNFYRLPSTVSRKAEANSLVANDTQGNGGQGYAASPTPASNSQNALSNYATTNQSYSQPNSAGLNNNFDRNTSNQTSATTNAAPAEFSKTGMQGVSPLNGSTNGSLIPAAKPASQTPGTVPASYGRYRVILTNRQQSELNEFIARRGNQWAERTNEAPRSLAVAGGLEAKTKLSDAESSVKVAAKDAENRPSPVATSQPRIAEDGTRSELQHSGKLDARNAPLDANDEAHEVVIVVNDQPVILPTVLPLSQTPPAASQPASGERVPVTQPASPTDAAKPPAAVK